jgi:hypothetical protein
MSGLGRVRAWAWAAAAVMGCGVAAASCSSGGGGDGSASGTSTTTAHGGSRVPTSASSTTTSGAGGSSTTTTAGAGGGVAPTLGVAGAFGANGVGFGAVRPTEISLGGDPTGILTGISWQSWGGAQATGTGTSTYVAPGQSVAQGTQETATVVASGLGTCKGAPAYQQVVWYFPQNGQTPADNGGTPIQACSGP